MYGPYLTTAEINAKYPNEWVLLGNPTNRRQSLEPTGGVVVLHAATRDEFYRLFEEWPGDPAIRETASHYTGHIGWRYGTVIPDDGKTEPGAA